MVDELIKRQFRIELYTIEYDYLVGGETIVMRSTGGSHATFDSNNFKVWNSIRDIKLHIKQISDTTKRDYIANHAVIKHYVYTPTGTVENTECLVEDLME